MHVFISHASEDKRSDRFRALVHKLYDVLYADERMPDELRVGLWIDRPQEVSTDPRLLACGRIPSGDTWQEAIEDALAHQDVCVLFCLSHASAAKLKGEGEVTTAGLEWELQQAQARRRLVAVKIDDVSPVALPERYRKIQFLDLSQFSDADERHNFRFVVDDIKQKLGLQAEAAETRLAAFVRRATQPKSLDHNIPYRADRHEQAKAFFATIYETQSRSATAPRPLIVAGPEEEVPAQFLDRCFRESRRVLGGEPCDKRVLQWPDKGEFAPAYVEELSTYFFGHPRAPREEVVRSLRSIRKLTVFYSILLAKDWSAQEPERVASWIEEWARFDTEAGGGLRVVPLLCLQLGRCGETQWHECPPTPAGQLFENRAILSSLRNCAARVDGRAQPLMPPLLAPLSRSDATTWLATVRDEASAEAGELLDRLEAVVDKLFKTHKRLWLWGADKENQVTMRRFATTIQNALGGTVTP